LFKLSNHVNLAILLALLASLGPMGIDTYIPSIPDIASTYGVSLEEVELSLAIFLIGLSVGQIFGGVISDNYGRRSSSIYGLIGFSFFSFLIIFSHSIYEIWIYRFFEAFFGGIVLVNSSAVVRDKFKGNEAAKVFSIIGTVRSVAPLIAPAIGAFIIHFFPWKGVFIFLTIYPLIILFIVQKYLDNTKVYEKQNILNSFYLVLSNKKAMISMFVLGLSFSGIFVFISKASFIYIESFGISTDFFPFYFSSHFVALMLLTKFNITLLKHFKILKIMKITLLIQTFICILFLLNYKDITLIETMVYLISYTGLMAFIFGNSLALAMNSFSKNAGVASSVAGVLQFGMASLVSAIVLSFKSEDFFILAISILVLTLSSFLILGRYKEN